MTDEQQRFPKPMVVFVYDACGYDTYIGRGRCPLTGDSGGLITENKPGHYGNPWTQAIPHLALCERKHPSLPSQNHPTRGRQRMKTPFMNNHRSVTLQEVRRCLLSACCTTKELADILDISVRQARIFMWCLTSKGQAEWNGRNVSQEKGRPLKLYCITTKGTRSYNHSRKIESNRREAS